MDINSLIDSDASGSAPRAPSASPSARQESARHFKHPDHFKSPQDIHQGFRDRGLDPQRSTNRGSGIEPPHVPPLRPPPHDEFRSPGASSYSSAQSPYPRTPLSALSGQYPFPQPSLHSPAQSAHSVPHYPQESPPFAMSTTHQGPSQLASLPQTPTSGTLSSSYPPLQQHRPPSSHSASTPTSSHAQTPTFFRESPQQSHAQIRGQYVSNPSQQYLSQPGTPLGPPSTLGRQGSGLRRESPSSFDHRQVNSAGSHGQHQQHMQSPNNAIRNHSSASPAVYDSVHAQPSSHQNVSINHDRERSLSVSPKTRLPSQPQLYVNASVPDPGRVPTSQMTPLKRKMGDSRVDEPSFQQQPSAKRSMSLGVGGMLNASHEYGSSNQRTQSQVHYNKYSPLNETPSPITERSSTSIQGPSAQASISSTDQRFLTHESILPPTATASLDRHPSHESHIPVQFSLPETTPILASPPALQHANDIGGHSKDIHATNSEPRAPNPSLQAPSRRVRYREVPIFAQSARQNRRIGARINGQQQHVGRSPSLVKQEPTAVSHPPIKEEINGHEIPSTEAVPSQLDPTGILGPWEPTITNVIPAEELTRGVMDYLIQTVVQMNGVAFGPAGGSTTGRGAMVEIEAKIGQIIDKNTNDRLRLPVMTECLLSRTDPNLRTAFRSSMTAAQHSRLNNFLNQAYLKSKPPPPGEPPKKPRVALDYVHTYETDTFYDLSQNALNVLPPSVQNFLDRRNKPKVRITTDQRTGKEMAKIIKVRISDIEVYSPQTPFDWRVSVSLEVNWDGDLRELVESTEGKNGKRPDRNKDRVSYKHSHYQIDLTQVKSAEAASKIEKEHELEIEVSSAAVREQGQLVLQGQSNKYEELIKGFVDNVRTLVRHCKD